MAEPQGYTAFLDRLATAPISWGICEVPGWGEQLSPDRVLSEMRELGFPATELGSEGFFPTAPAALASLLAQHDLRLLGGFVPLILHEPGHAAETRRRARHAAALLSEAGAWHFVTAAVTSWVWDPRRPLAESEWAHTAAMLDEVEKIASEHGLVQVLHPHVGTIVETANDVTEILARSAVRWCLDTGHLYIGGTDPLEFAREHGDRIGLVHLKDVVAEVVPALNRGELTLMEAVQAGIFSNLGSGDIPLAEIVSLLEQGGYQQWYVVEQDTALTGDLPPEGHGPIEDVRRSLEFLRSIDV